MNAPLTAAQIARLRRVPDYLDGTSAAGLLELPLVDNWAAGPGNAYALRLYRSDTVEVYERADGETLRKRPSRNPESLKPAGWAFYLPWEKNPVPLNKASGRSHWSHQAKLVRPVRETAFALARAARIPPQARIRVRLDWIVNLRRDRDEDNVIGTMKALVDGVRLAGVVQKDTREHVLRDMPDIHYRHRDALTAHQRLTITPIERTP